MHARPPPSVSRASSVRSQASARRPRSISQSQHAMSSIDGDSRRVVVARRAERAPSIFNSIFSSQKVTEPQEQYVHKLILLYLYRLRRCHSVHCRPRPYADSNLGSNALRASRMMFRFLDLQSLLVDIACVTHASGVSLQCPSQIPPTCHQSAARPIIFP